MQQSEIFKKQSNIEKEISVIWRALPYILPGLILVCTFVIYPMFFNIAISFSDYKIVSGKMEFTGLQNYLSLFTDPEHAFWYAYRNNLLYAAITTPAILMGGLFFAVLIHSLKAGQVFFRTAFYLPVITSWVIVGLVFLYLFNSNERGLVNYLLVDVFKILPHHVSWLQNEWTGNLVIWLLGIWKNTGWCMVIYIAGLQGIPRDLYDAAEIEGAGSAARLFRITMPMLKPTTFFLAVNLIIGAFNVFLQVFILTKGAPNGRTSVLQYLLYDRSFHLFKFGEGAAIGVLTGITVYLITIILNRTMRVEQE